MTREDYLKIYIALRTAADVELATKAVATLRLGMIAEFGEEEQKIMVDEGNAVDLSHCDSRCH